MVKNLIEIGQESKAKKTKASQLGLQQSSICSKCGSAIFVSMKLHSMVCYEYLRIPSLAKTALSLSKKLNSLGWYPQKDGLINGAEFSKPPAEDMFYSPVVVSTAVPQSISCEALIEKIIKTFSETEHKIVISECRNCSFPRGFILSKSGKVEFDYLCFCGTKPLMPIQTKLESLKLWINRNVEKSINLLSQEYEIIKKGFPELSYLCFAGGVANALQGCNVRPEEAARKTPESPMPLSSGEKP